MLVVLMHVVVMNAVVVVIVIEDQMVLVEYSVVFISIVLHIVQLIVLDGIHVIGNK